MPKHDKLNRWESNDRMALATLRANVPYWIALTDREYQRCSSNERKQFFLRNARDRKAFRDFVRSLA